MFQLTNNKKLIQKNIAIIKEQYKAKIEQHKAKIEQHNIKIKALNAYNKINTSFEISPNINSIIPLNFYTCWHTKDLPHFMKENYDQLVLQNPEFIFHLYDEYECREFIKINFDKDILEAYDRLIPCAYKADLWRYCVLYKNGGIYMDIKFKCVNNFKLIALTDKEYFVRDIPEKYIYNALIITVPKNEILLKCINQIVINVKMRYYGNNCLLPTGPGLLGSFFQLEEINNFELYHNFSEIENILKEYYIVYKNGIILKMYDQYRQEQSQIQKNKRYGDLWDLNQIYK